MREIKFMFKRPMFYFFILLLIDQLTKYFVRNNFYLGESINFLPFFSLTYLANTGIAFSMFQGSNTFFIILSIVIFLGLCFWYIKNQSSMTIILKTAVILIISGAAGNIMDRLFWGHVIDFLDFNIGSYHWPAFNAADSYICVGGIVLFFIMLTDKYKIETRK